MEDAEKLLEFAKRLAREAGPIILEYFEAADKMVETKQDATPVTAADKLVNQLVIDRVSAAYPEHGILAEEGSQHEDRTQLWVCDPIDGTKGFIQRIPTAMFSLAYVVDGQPEVAVMLDPFQDKLFSAVRGQGAMVNGRQLKVTAHDQLKGATIAISSSYPELTLRREFFDGLMNHGATQVLVSGNVFRSSLVATAHADAHIFPGRSAHDVAATKLIIEEAGGKVTDLRGEDQRYDEQTYGALITNGHLHDQLVELLAAFGPENYLGY